MIFYENNLSMPQQVLKNKNDIEDLNVKVLEDSFSPRGAYSASETYKYRDSVFFTDNKTYIHTSKVETQGIAPDVLTGNPWTLYSIAIPGPQGDKGEPGTPLDLITLTATQGNLTRAQADLITNKFFNTVVKLDNKYYTPVSSAGNVYTYAQVAIDSPSDNNVTCNKLICNVGGLTYSVTDVILKRNDYIINERESGTDLVELNINIKSIYFIFIRSGTLTFVDDTSFTGPSLITIQRRTDELIASNVKNGVVPEVKLIGSLSYNDYKVKLAGTFAGIIEITSL